MYLHAAASISEKDWGLNTRTGGGSENHTVWRGGGAYNAPIDLSSYES